MTDISGHSTSVSPSSGDQLCQFQKQVKSTCFSSPSQNQLIIIISFFYISGSDLCFVVPGVLHCPRIQQQLEEHIMTVSKAEGLAWSDLAIKVQRHK